MSEVGQTRRFDGGPATSGLPPSTDIARPARHVSKVPNPDIAAKQKPPITGRPAISHVQGAQ